MPEHGHHHHQHLDRSALSSRDGIRAIKISTLGLAVTATIQFSVVLASASVALLADALHNFGDVFTTIALWMAFVASRRAADRRYTYGFDRFEDLVGVFIVLVIAASAALAGWESVQALVSPQPLAGVWITVVAGAVGMIGNEAVARYKIRVGRRLGSIALEADGQHSRTDALGSAGVVLGAVGVSLGFDRADAIAAAFITAMIVWVMFGAARDVFARIVDRVDPAVVDAVEASATKVGGVLGVEAVRARWAGRSLFVQLHIAVDQDSTVAVAHEVGEQVRHAVFHDVEGVAQVTVHLDPHDAEGEGDYHSSVSHHDEGAPGHHRHD